VDIFGVRAKASTLELHFTCSSWTGFTLLRRNYLPRAMPPYACLHMHYML